MVSKTNLVSNILCIHVAAEKLEVSVSLKKIKDKLAQKKKEKNASKKIKM